WFLGNYDFSSWFYMGIDIEKEKLACSLHIPIGIDHIGSPFAGFLGKTSCPRDVVFKPTADIIPRCRGIEHFPSHPYGLQLVWNTNDVPFLKDNIILGSWFGKNFLQLNTHIFRFPDVQLCRSSVHSFQ